ncbi:MAG: hypothetical protein JNL57_01970 [Bacteroidetes bacterium]|nr:hypothetical protein [Bacteroidota bacterium]
MKLVRRTDFPFRADVQLSGSKSISNRMLIAASLCGMPFSSIHGLSDANDTQLLAHALTSKPGSDIYLADGAAPFRFFLAWAAALNFPCKIHISPELAARPSGPLLRILRACGAQISETETGYRVLKGMEQFPETLEGGEISSQYASAMLLVAPVFHGTKRLQLTGSLVSKPYLDMTLRVMQQFGVNATRDGNSIVIPEGGYEAPESIRVEPDWSSAAFFYSLVACAGVETELPGLSLNSLQGDVVCAKIYEKLGVETTAFQNGVHIRRKQEPEKQPEFSFENAPDLAPAVIACCAYLGLHASFKGLQNLKYKESDRLQAIKTNLATAGIEFTEKNDVWKLRYLSDAPPVSALTIQSFSDHRIAMAMALFALKTEVHLDDAGCVKKSFPGFWSEWGTWFSIAE